MSNTEKEFKPDWASPPGETIIDILEERKLSVSEFSQQMGYEVSQTDDLLAGKMGITEEVADKLSDVLGSSMLFWLQRENQYREDLERIEFDKTSSRWKEFLADIRSRITRPCDNCKGDPITLFTPYRCPECEDGITLDPDIRVDEVADLIDEIERLQKENLRLRPGHCDLCGCDCGGCVGCDECGKDKIG
jgi:plasmid maintenance system antidote protein VapI